MSEEMLREVPIYEVGTRKSLLMGCDRELLLAAFLGASLMWFAAPSVATGIGAAVMALVLLRLLRMMAKKDVYMRDVFVRHLTYTFGQSFYFAKPTVFAFCKKKYK